MKFISFWKPEPCSSKAFILIFLEFLIMIKASLNHLYVGSQNVQGTHIHFCILMHYIKLLYNCDNIVQNIILQLFLMSVKGTV